MYKRLVQIPVLLVAFLFGVIGWVDSSASSTEGIQTASYSVEYGYDGVHIHDQEAIAVHEHIQSSDSNHEKRELLATENVEGEDYEFSQKKSTGIVAFLNLSANVLQQELGNVRLKKRLVYYNNQQCFYPLKHLFLLFEVFRL